MNPSPLQRLGALFLEPATDRTVSSAPPVVSSRAPRLVAVIAAAEHLPAAAGGVAATLRRAAPGRAAAVVCRPGDPPRGGRGRRSAAAVARRLGGRGLDAAACGPLCHVRLANDATAAVRDVWRVAGAVDAPVVVALPGRPDGYDDLLAQLDHLVLAAPLSADPSIVELAMSSLAALGPATTRAVPPSTIVGRRAAALGLSAVALDALRERRPGGGGRRHDADASADRAPVEPARAGARP